MSRKETHYYNGEEHIFHNDHNNNVYLKAAQGQTLIIEGYSSNPTSGTDTQVIYNSSGTLTGNNNLTYDGSYLITPSIKATGVYGTVVSTGSGYNEIYTGTSPANLITSQTTDYRELGTDVCMSRNVNYAAYACPYYIPAGTSLGGISIWKETAGIYAEYGSLLSYTSFSFDCEINFASINENADLAILSTLNTPVSSTTFTRSGSVWTTKTSFLDNTLGTKISGTTLLRYSPTSKFSIYSWNGTNWNLTQDLYNAASASSILYDWPISLTSTTAILGYNNTIKVFTLSGTWTQQSSTAVTSLTSLDNYGTIFCYVANGTLYIQENFIASASFVISGGYYCCTNGTYVFVNTTGGVIYIYSKVGAVWTQSVNTTSFTNGKKIACNANYLTVGAPLFGLYGRAGMFSIVPFSPTTSNTSLLLNDAGDVSLNASTNSIRLKNNTFITGNTEVSGEVLSDTYRGISVLNSTSVATGSVVLAGGLGVAKTIFATTYSSPNGAFKMNTYTATTSQSITGSTDTRLLLGTNVLSGISTLTKSTVGGGSVFTTSIDCKLMINYSCRINGTTYMDTYVRIGATGVFYGQISSTDSSGPACCGSCILNLVAGETFAIWIYLGGTANVSVNATYLASSLQVYSLN